jgi:hypothetical protein
MAAIQVAINRAGGGAPTGVCNGVSLQGSTSSTYVMKIAPQSVGYSSCVLLLLVQLEYR